MNHKHLKEKAIKKWSPPFEQMGISEFRKKEFCLYAEHHSYSTTEYIMCYDFETKEEIEKRWKLYKPTFKLAETTHLFSLALKTLIKLNDDVMIKMSPPCFTVKESMCVELDGRDHLEYTHDEISNIEEIIIEKAYNDIIIPHIVDNELVIHLLFSEVRVDDEQKPSKLYYDFEIG